MCEERQKLIAGLFSALVDAYRKCEKSKLLVFSTYVEPFSLDRDGDAISFDVDGRSYEMQNHYDISSQKQLLHVIDFTNCKMGDEGDEASNEELVGLTKRVQTIVEVNQMAQNLDDKEIELKNDMVAFCLGIYQSMDEDDVNSLHPEFEKAYYLGKEYAELKAESKRMFFVQDSSGAVVEGTRSALPEDSMLSAETALNKTWSLLKAEGMLLISEPLAEQTDAIQTFEEYEYIEIIGISEDDPSHPSKQSYSDICATFEFMNGSEKKSVVINASGSPATFDEWKFYCFKMAGEVIMSRFGLKNVPKKLVSFKSNKFFHEEEDLSQEEIQEIADLIKGIKFESNQVLD